MDNTSKYLSWIVIIGLILSTLLLSCSKGDDGCVEVESITYQRDYMGQIGNHYFVNDEYVVTVLEARRLKQGDTYCP